ncbi:MAG: hypothetical protein N4J56_007442 [Chroococcidiopsis sp. SAG 2025]|uniref:hypothetical protein n=1 Tax=Chroococcidiopsis sp. SAG 2025 TaxID=171389 RepID=UPI00293713EA|nr:hypothetical protein [Chroococcidiopsis sp. SAG 2025]MDV2997737.1 hypothetical protein [Chroococcidiopsis sp. SAG 2025]
MSSPIASDSESSDAFYRQPCWLDIWLDQCSTTQLEFWSQFDESDALFLLSLLEQAGFVTRLGDRTPPRFRAHPTYYQNLRFYRVDLKPPVRGAKTVKRCQNTLHFRNTVGRMWTSMRILQTFSIGQLQACTDTGNEPAQRIVSQLYRFNYLRLQQQYHPCFAGNEDVYCLVRNTGAKAPLLFASGILYDPNTHQIHQARG